MAVQQEGFTTEQQEQYNEIRTLGDLLNFLKCSIMIDTHCSTLAFFSDIEKKYDEDIGYGIAKFKPFPLIENQEEYIIYAYYFNEETEFERGKIYCIIFMDNNFKQNLKEDYPIKTSDETKHSLSFGVVIETK